MSEKEINDIIDQIQSARAKNNFPWMNLMRIAFKYAPLEAAECMKQICDMDKEITALARKLTE